MLPALPSPHRHGGGAAPAQWASGGQCRVGGHTGGLPAWEPPCPVGLVGFQVLLSPEQPLGSAGERDLADRTLVTAPAGVGDKPAVARALVCVAGLLAPAPGAHRVGRGRLPTGPRVCLPAGAGTLGAALCGFGRAPGWQAEPPVTQGLEEPANRSLKIAQPGVLPAAQGPPGPPPPALLPSLGQRHRPARHGHLWPCRVPALPPRRARPHPPPTALPGGAPSPPSTGPRPRLEGPPRPGRRSVQLPAPTDVQATLAVLSQGSPWLLVTGPAHSRFHGSGARCLGQLWPRGLAAWGGFQPLWPGLQPSGEASRDLPSRRLRVSTAWCHRLASPRVRSPRGPGRRWDAGCFLCSPDTRAPFTPGCRGGPWGVRGLRLPRAGWRDGSLGPLSVALAHLLWAGPAWPPAGVDGPRRPCFFLDGRARVTCRWVAAPERAGSGTRLPRLKRTLDPATGPPRKGQCAC